MAKITDPDLLAALSGKAATSVATQTKAEPETKTPAPPAKKSMMDTIFPRGTPAWMQGGAPVEGDIVSDPSNPFSYIREDQKTEQGAAGKAISKAVQNTMRVGAGLAQGAVLDPAIALAQVLPFDVADQFAREGAENYVKFRQGMGGEGFDFARLGGNVLSPVNAGAIKAANWLSKGYGGGKFATSPFAKGATQGAISGVTMPVLGESGGAMDEGQSLLAGKLMQAGAGGLFGGGLNKLASASQGFTKKIGDQLAPNKLTPQQEAMLRNRVLKDVDIDTLNQAERVSLYKQMNPDAYLTWGQRAGDLGSSIEQKAMSIPFVGDAIRHARQKALGDWQKSQMQAVAKEGGITLEKTSGRKGFDELSKKLSTRYDEVLEDAKLSDPAGLRSKIIGSMDESGNYTKGKISDTWNELDEASRKKVDKLLEDKVFKKFGVDPDGNHSIPMSGTQFKKAEESLKEKIKELAGGTGEEKTMARVLRSTLDEMYDSLQSSKPELGKELKSLNKAYAKYKTLLDASTASSASRGSFNPSQVVKAAQKGEGRSHVGRGRNEQAYEAQLAQDAFGDFVPDSGTATRLMLAGGLYGTGSYATDPMTAAGIGAGLYGVTRGVYNPALVRSLTGGASKLGQRWDQSRVGRALAPHADEISTRGATFNASDVGENEFSQGGLTNLVQKARSLDNPRPSGITPTTVNVKARMSPRYARGGLMQAARSAY